MQPSIGTWNTNGWIRTGRARNTGFRANLYAAAKSRYYETEVFLHNRMVDYALGGVTAAITRPGGTVEWNIMPVWMDWATGVVLEGWSYTHNYVPVSGDLYAPFLEWEGERADWDIGLGAVLFLPPLLVGTGMDEMVCQRIIIAPGVQEGVLAGSEEYGRGRRLGTAEDPSFDYEKSCTVQWIIPTVEEVEGWQDIDPLEDDQWIYPSHAASHHMGQTNLRFRNVRTEADAVMYVDVGDGPIEVELDQDDWDSVILSAEQDVYLKLTAGSGLGGTIYPGQPSPLFPPVTDIEYKEGVGAGFYQGAAFATTRSLLASASIGTTEVDCRLGYDGETAKLYYYQASGTQAVDCGYDTRTERVEGEDNELRLYSNAGDIATRIEAAWSDIGISYKFLGHTREMDGSACSADREYQALVIYEEEGSPQAEDTWESDTTDSSPLIVYSGAWTLTAARMAAPVTGISESYSPGSGDSDYVAIGQWARNEPAPLAFGFKMTNPTDIGAASDDGRMQLQYPRSRLALSWAYDEVVTVDPMNTKSPTDDGIGGWTGHNCTVTDSGTYLTISDVTAGAYIYRADFLTGYDADEPLYWPFQRFCWIRGAAFESIGIGPVKLSAGGVTTKELSHYFDWDYGAQIGSAFDTCMPSDAGDPDHAQSYITQVEPAAEGEDNLCYPRQESPETSWSWGAGLFDRIQIDLTAGKTYQFTGLFARRMQDTGKIEAHREYDPEMLLGYWDAAEGEDEDWHTVHVHRMVIAHVDGSYGFEAASIQKHTTDLGAVTRSNFAWGGLAEDCGWPLDDWGAINWTDEIGVFDSGWWDGSVYTDETALFASDVTPMWFLDDTGGDMGTAQPRDPETALYVRPLGDYIWCDPWYGDGVVDSERVGYCAFYFTKFVLGRPHGLGWLNESTPYELTADSAGQITVDVNSAGIHEEVDPDDAGYWIADSAHTNPCRVYLNGIVSGEHTEIIDTVISGLKSRHLYRLGMQVEWREHIEGNRMRHGKAWTDLPDGVTYRDVELLTN